MVTKVAPVLNLSNINLSKGVYSSFRKILVVFVLLPTLFLMR